ncbi:MAG: hypothetical protein ACRDUV_08760 [Pseudonocardiaceae bacterium]
MLDGVDPDREVLGGGQVGGVGGVGGQGGALQAPAAVHQDGSDETGGDYRGGHGAPDPAGADDPQGGRVWM